MTLAKTGPGGTINQFIWKVIENGREQKLDSLAIEAPLEISLSYGAKDHRQEKSISVTMRTPGQDFELATGFLFTEGIIQSPDQVQGIRHLDAYLPELERNQVRINLHPEVAIDLDRLERHFYTSSSCGVCGKSSIDAVRVSNAYAPLSSAPRVKAEVIHQLPGRLRQQQVVFDCTGGLHASALFDQNGALLLLREDVGRHNALDKLIGGSFQQNWLPSSSSMLSLSGRISFELVQKALLAGIPIVVAVGAPSSLAVDLAQETGMTLIGFARDGRFNIYSHPERIV